MKVRFCIYAGCAVLGIWSIVEAPWASAQYSRGGKSLHSVQRGPLWQPPQLEFQSQSPRLMLEILTAQWAGLAIICFATHRLIRK